MLLVRHDGNPAYKNILPFSCTLGFVASTQIHSRCRKKDISVELKIVIAVAAVIIVFTVQSLPQQTVLWVEPAL